MLFINIEDRSHSSTVLTGSPVRLSRVNGAERRSKGMAISRDIQDGLARSVLNRIS